MSESQQVSLKGPGVCIIITQIFQKNLGYDNTNAGTLERDLLAFAHDISVGETIVSEWGIKYVITSALHTPSGESVYLRTVWIVDQGESRPRFVTAYPD